MSAVSGRVQRHDVAPLQQLVERDVVGRGLGPGVVGQHPAAEPAQPVHDRGADASRADDPDGQVAQLLAAYLVQPVVVGVGAAMTDFA